MEEQKNQIELGKILTIAREGKSLSVEDVASITKIRKEFLQALEEENYSLLPERTYALGYFRSYAKFLGIENYSELVDILDRQFKFFNPEYSDKNQQPFLEDQYSIVNSLKKNVKLEKNKNSNQEKQVTEKSNYKLIVIIVLLGLIFLYLGYSLLSRKSKDQALSSASENNIENIVSQNKITNDFVVIDNLGEKNTASQNTEQTKTTEEALEQEAPVPEKPEVIYRKWPEPNRDYQISISFVDDVWIKIYKKDEPIVAYIDKVFKAGEIYDIPAVDNIAMTVGNYKGVKIVVDSKEIQLTSTRKSLVLNDIILDKESLLRYPVVER